jgi:F0F1-type ATP synthase gamma subunit
MLFVCCFTVVPCNTAYATGVIEGDEDAGEDTNTIIENDPSDSDVLGITIGTDSESVSSALQIVIVLTVIALCPSILIMLTAFTRILVVLHFTRSALNKFINKEIGKIKLVYTRYVNSVTFQPVIVDLLPVSKPQIFEEKDENKIHKDTLFEPDATTILNTLIPMYFESSLYGKFVECHVSEQASRRMAMENASDNADEIIEQLQLQYNKARQSAITQEITEVVAGADA